MLRFRSIDRNTRTVGGLRYAGTDRSVVDCMHRTRSVVVGKLFLAIMLVGLVVLICAAAYIIAL
jgi:hypothetical protein